LIVLAIGNIAGKINSAIQGKTELKYKADSSSLISESEPWNLMFSMREIDSTGVILIN